MADARRVLQLSDLHLRPDTTRAASVLALLESATKRLRPDLIVASGDLTDDAFERPEEFARLRAVLERAVGPFLAVPGNHDVGNKASLPEQPVRQAWLDAWWAAFETDRFAVDRAGWRLLGLNTQILGSDLEAERDQQRWLEARLREVDGPVALFLHAPLWVRDPEEPGDGLAAYWNADESPRKRLRALLAEHDVRLIASGHTHWHAEIEREGARWVWALPMASPVDDPLFPPGHGAHGAVLHELGPERATARPIPLDTPTAPVRLRRPTLEAAFCPCVLERVIVDATNALTVGEQTRAALQHISQSMRVVLLLPPETHAPPGPFETLRVDAPGAGCARVPADLRACVLITDRPPGGTRPGLTIEVTPETAHAAKEPHTASTGAGLQADSPAQALDWLARPEQLRRRLNVAGASPGFFGQNPGCRPNLAMGTCPR
jgi:alkaline phosphatase D